MLLKLLFFVVVLQVACAKPSSKKFPLKLSNERKMQAVAKNQGWKDTAAAQGKNITCNSVIAYYNGLFHNEYDKKDTIEVNFQTQMSLNARNRLVYYDIDHWSEVGTRSSDIQLWYQGDDFASDECSPAVNNNCSASYLGEAGFTFNLLYFVKGDAVNQFEFAYFPDVDNQFTLYNAIGQCTNYMPTFQRNVKVDPKYVDYCICCGVYNPDPSLNCPKNPWA